MRLSLVIHPFRTEAADIATGFAAAAIEKGFSVEAAEADAPRVTGVAVRPEGAPIEADLIVGVGGDGTVLEALRQGIQANAPVLGVNAGHMGFLTEIEPARIPEALDAIVEKRYILSERMTLAVHLADSDPILGINDAVIEKAMTQHVIRVAAWVGGERFIGYRADGVIVATPTGSTAYNFSAGGPLVDPELDALVVTPVAPHTLFGRPLVFGPEVRLRFEVEGDRSARLNIDGRSQRELLPGEAVDIETGAGKTLLLGALRLLRGDNARTDRIGPAAAEARVDGRFLTDDGELTVGRRVTPARSRAYVDGTMSPAGVLAERLAGVIEIIGQHEHITLSRDRAIRGIVDAALDASGVECLAGYREAWSARQALLADQETIGGDRRTLERELDLARHQAREIDAAGFEAGEDNQLASNLGRLRHAEEIAEALALAHGSLGEDGAADSLGSAVDAVRSAAVHDPGLEALTQRLEAAAQEVTATAADLRRTAESLEHDPAVLEEAEQRMAVLGDLRRKYGDTLAEVLEYGDAAAAKATNLATLLERSDSLAKELEAADAAIGAAAETLSEARRQAAKHLSSIAGGHLKELGFQDPIIDISVEPATPGPSGGDKVKLLFASDAALEPAPVGRIASGGELSRLVLAIHLAAGVADVPVVAFDEIDAGIGGSTALAMGRKLADLSTGRQVFVVTHLPQVAAFADVQYVVERDGPVASVRKVEGDDRIAELTRMLGGLPESEQGRSHAAELVGLANQHRGG